MRSTSYRVERVLWMLLHATAWNHCEAPFWSRMVTCAVTLRAGLTT